MKLSLPDEMDEADVPEAGGEGDRDGVPASTSAVDGTVQVFGGEMEVSAAIEQIGEMLERPEAFGMVPSSRLTELNEQLAELEDENDQLRHDLAVIWQRLSVDGPKGEQVVPKDDGMGSLPESVGKYDPLGEFEE